jgi:hypothetical protein
VAVTTEGIADERTSAAVLAQGRRLMQRSKLDSYLGYADRHDSLLGEAALAPLRKSNRYLT